MNKKQKKLNKVEKKLHFTFSSAHIIIAIVAIIECLILVSFATYSWIETASSLIIWNGKQSIVDSEYTKMDIVDTLNYQFRVNSANANTNDPADLNTFFRDVKYYQFAKTSSPDGKNFFFKNHSTARYAYRDGDTTDYNTSYTYFDFSVNNSGYTPLTKLKFFFADADVFQISPGTSGLTNDQCKAIETAMRISFQVGSGGAANIYSEFNNTYSGDSRTYPAVSTSAGETELVTAYKIKNDQDQKLFTVAKNGTVQISCRIWLESQDPVFIGNSYTAEQLAGLDININLKLSYASNEYDYLYFDDYTFSNAQANNGGHLTEDFVESNNNRMYFVYRTGSSGGTVYPMTKDNSGSNPNAASWVTCNTSGNAAATVPNTDSLQYITQLCTANSNAVKNSFFAYGPCNLNTSSFNGLTPIYTWYLNSQSSDDYEHRFNAFSVVDTKLTSTSATVTYGAGGWNYNTPLSMIYFRDRATCLTDNSYNAGDNFRYITNAVNIAADTDETKTRNNVLYLSNNTGAIPTTAADMKTRAQITANMYYDTNLDNRGGLFKSWIPTAWTQGSAMTFRYCPNSTYNNSVISWEAGAPSLYTGSDDYIYTALGYNTNYNLGYYDAVVQHSTSVDSRVAAGCGTWNAIESEPVYFSAELIDNDVDGNQRFKVGVSIGGSFTYYHLVPDDSNQKFYAYLPDPKNGNPNLTTDYSAGAIRFIGYNGIGGSAQVNGRWFANVRNGSDTYYPVRLETTTTTTDYTRGYWHISVIVDGTYEHLFWDYGDPVDSSDDDVLGNFYYNLSGHPSTDPDASHVTDYYDEITPYNIDEYRWYVPLDDNPSADFVYYRWDPYEDVTLKFNHSRSDGIYCVVTEAQ